MKNAIVYYSFSNNNASLAVYLSKHLNCERFRIETIRKRNGFSIFLDILFHRRPAVKRVRVCMADYDHVIFVAPIWAGQIAAPLVSFMMKEREMINQYSFISLCGGREGQKDKVDCELVSIMGKKPKAHMQLSVSDLPKVENKPVTGNVEYQMLNVFDTRLEEFIHAFDFAGAV